MLQGFNFLWNAVFAQIDIGEGKILDRTAVLRGVDIEANQRSRVRFRVSRRSGHGLSDRCRDKRDACNQA